MRINNKEQLDLDKFKYEAINGDIVIMHEFNWDYSKRIGVPYKAIILWNSNGQPLCLQCSEIEKGVYRPTWRSYESIIEIVGHVELSNLFLDKLN